MVSVLFTGQRGAVAGVCVCVCVVIGHEGSTETRVGDSGGDGGGDGGTGGEGQGGVKGRRRTEKGGFKVMRLRAEVVV